MAEPSFIATPKQVELVEATLGGEYLYIAMGGGIRGTKTWGTLSTIILLCRIYPGSRWAVVRKDLPTLRRNTVPSLNKLRNLAAGFLGELKQDTWTYTCANGSEIILFPESFSTDSDLDRWKGLEVNGFLLEEANELAEPSANKAIERAGSWIIPKSVDNPRPVQPPPYVFFTFNPCANWPRFWFYEPAQSGSLRPPYCYIPATAADNPYIPDAVREAWKNLPDAEYARFVEGSWDFTDDPDQLIKAEWVWAARDIEPIPGVQRLGVDPARFGDDESTIAVVVGNALLKMYAYPKLSTDQLADKVMALAGNEFSPVEPEDIRIDTVGLGAGVADMMRRDGWKGITEIVAGGTPWARGETFYTFKNVRAQMWWEAREKFRTGQISLPQEVHPKLITDLTAMKYRIHADKSVEVWTKEKVKGETGRSTDYADAFLHAILDPPVRRPNRKKLPPSTSARTLR